MLFPKIVENLNFKAVIENEIKDIKLTDFECEYIVLIFYPHDFTFVCPTEIIRMSNMYSEFKNENTMIFFISTDSVYSHLVWKSKAEKDNGIGNVKWPMISDITHKLSEQFNLYNDETGTVMRSTVILNGKLEVKHISANVDPIGRSSGEILRLIKALRYHDKHGEVCFVDFGKN